MGEAAVEVTLARRQGQAGNLCSGEEAMAPGRAWALAAVWAPLAAQGSQKGGHPRPGGHPPPCAPSDSYLNFLWGAKHQRRMLGHTKPPRRTTPGPRQSQAPDAGGALGGGRGYVTGGAGVNVSGAPGGGGAGRVLSREEPGSSVLLTPGQPPPRPPGPRVLWAPASRHLGAPRPGAGVTILPRPERAGGGGAEASHRGDSPAPRPSLAPQLPV